MRRQFGLTSTKEREGTGDLLSISHGLFASYSPLKASVVLRLPAGGQQQTPSWPSHMPILMLCMIWKIARGGKKTDSSETRQLTLETQSSQQSASADPAPRWLAQS